MVSAISATESRARIAKQILAEKDLQLRYFSYPYLYTRKNDEHQRFEKWLGDRGQTPLVFAGLRGGPLRRSGWNKATSWPHVVAHLGLTGLHFHDLRHEAAVRGGT